LPGLFWKTEYRFADYGKEQVNVLVDNSRIADTLDAHKYVYTVRSELVWRFNFGGPVAARY
jgi:outer membrane immunogenic protein